MTKSSHSPLPPTSSSPGDATEGATSSTTSSATSSIDPRAAPRGGGNGPAPPDPSGQDIPLLDLCGELCPFTFVRTKLALEELPIGAQLRVIVDHEPATRNIPRSAAEWGQEVIAVVGLSPRTWAIDLRKRVR